MRPAIRILVVEDEAFTRTSLCLELCEKGFLVHEAEGAVACRVCLERHVVDVVVLDLSLGDEDGLALVGELHRRGSVGVMVATRRASPEARIQALDVGADDYLVKPLHVGELAARIRSLMRRRERGAGSSALGPWTIDFETRTLVRGSRRLDLTRGEFNVLVRLLAGKGQTVSRADLLGALSRRHFDTDPRSVDVLISRIRRKLDDFPGGGRLILTIPGIGYSVNDAAPAG